MIRAQRQIGIAIGLAALLSILAPAPSEAGDRNPPDRPIYRYTDSNGTIVYTDHLSLVPPSYRSSARGVELPPLLMLPGGPGPSSARADSLIDRAKETFRGWPTEVRLAVGGVLPVALLSLWALNFLRKRSEGALTRIFLRIGMVGILLATAAICYVLFIRGPASKWTGGFSTTGAGLPIPESILDPLKRAEGDRFRKIEKLTQEP